MEDSSRNRTFAVIVLRGFFVIAVILLPIGFAVGVWNIAHIASNSGIFYMRPELPTLITILLFPLTWIYLGIRRSRPKTARRFAAVTALIILSAMSVSTSMETASIASMAKIDRGFTPPDGWVTEPNFSDAEFSPGGGLISCPTRTLEGVEKICPAIGHVWKKDEENPMTLQELQHLATANGFKDFTADKSCEKEVSSYGAYECILSGKVDSTDVSLSYSRDDIGHSLLILHLK